MSTARSLCYHAICSFAGCWGMVLSRCVSPSVSLGIGVVGYHSLEGLPWLDALLNASMILGGMGPVSELRTVAGKLFASAYALFSGVAFLATVGILVAPLVHRLLHHLHLEAGNQ